MKRLSILAMVVTFLFPLAAFSQVQTDPGLTSAVAAQTIALEEIAKKRKEKQDKIIEFQTAIGVVMTSIHDVENKTLEYMSNASSAMENIYQIQKAATLCKNIEEQMRKMVKAVPSNYEGTAVTVLTSNTSKDVITEMVSLSTLMSQLVTSTKYSFGDNSDSSSGKKNVNLLSAAERYYIANEVVTRLNRIYRKLWVITWEIENLGWEDAWHRMDPSGWAKANHGKSIAENLARKWKNSKIF